MKYIIIDYVCIHTICLNLKNYNYKHVIKLSIYFGKNVILYICRFSGIIDYIFNNNS